MQAVLFEVPHTETEWSRWSWNHRDSHLRIIQSIAAQGGPSLTQYILDPISLDNFQQFLELNGLAHLQMNGAVGTQGAELDDLNPRDNSQLVAWIFEHAEEHRMVEDRLGL